MKDINLLETINNLKGDSLKKKHILSSRPQLRFILVELSSEEKAFKIRAKGIEKWF